MNDFLIGLLSNVVWVVAVFLWLTVRDRKRRQQEQRCLEASMVWLLRSAGLVRHTVWPYVHLMTNRTSEARILGNVLGEIDVVLRQIVEQLQQMLRLTPGDAGQAALLAVYRHVIAFQSAVAESRVASNPVVGNPADLVEGVRGDRELQVYRAFAGGYPQQVRQVLSAVPAGVRLAMPEDALGMLDAKSELEKALG
ncbi:MAG: hypothetical protein AB7S36_06105 [Planctomycetota bacterium]